MSKKNDIEFETGFFKEDDLPYLKIGNNKEVLLELEALTFKNEPESGMFLKATVKSRKILCEKYTVYYVGRKRNVPEDYNFEKMAEDYANLIKREFKGPVNVMGVSTGGQILQYLAANHPETVKKIIIISAAYRLSVKGKEIETKTAEYFKNGQYGKSFGNLIRVFSYSSLKLGLMKLILTLFGKKIIGKVENPNDLLTEIKGDIEMDFKDRLKDIKAPTLVICGEKDIPYDINDVRETAKGIENSEIKVFKGIGHELSLDHYNKLSEEILRFLGNELVEVK